MSLIRWLSVAVVTLATSSALHAQTASFSIFGLTSVFGQETRAETTPSILPWVPGPTGNVFGLTVDFNFSALDESEEAEELPAPRRGDVHLSQAFVPECLKYWKEQWSLGNFREAEMLAAIACRLDPANSTAQHALVLAQIMQGLTADTQDSDECPDGPSNVSITEKVAQALLGEELGSGLVQLISRDLSNLNSGSPPEGTLTPDLTSFPSRVTQAIRNSADSVGSQPTCAVQQACCKEAARCCAEAGAARTCPCSPAKETKACAGCAMACACAPKADCCCAKAGQRETSSCACAPKAPACCCGAKAPAVKEGAKCGCDKDCGCCKCAAPEKKARSVTLPASTIRLIREVSSSAESRPQPEDLQNILSAPTSSVPGPVIAVSPPYYLSGPIPMPPPLRVPMPPPGFGPGLPQGLPTPDQVFQDLECARSAALNKARAGWQPPDMPGQPVAKHNVHLVTQHLEAHCERLSSAGNSNHILLEGDVHLVCNRNGQTLRIQGQRVLVNLSDGTFTVESMAEARQPAPAPRVSAPLPPGAYSQHYSAPPVPWEVVRPVRPVSNSSPYVPHEPEE